jgi:hypothetical protein
MNHPLSNALPIKIRGHHAPMGSMKKKMEKAKTVVIN